MIRRIAFTIAATGIPLAAGAQTSALYLGDWSSGQSWVVQDGQVIEEYSRSAFDDGPGLAVGSTVRYIGMYPGSVGHEYSLDGDQLDGVYPNADYDSLYDGATDGRTRNWSIAHNDFDDPQFTVVVGDQDWGGLKPAFQPTRRSSGITYDARTDSLWITNTEGGGTAVQQYTTDGQFLSEFPISIPGAYCMAWDPADDTLWVVESFGQAQIHQFLKDGTLLQTLAIAGISNTVLGAEFAIRVEDDCYPDFDGDGDLSLFDFLAFVNAFNAGDASAECDGDEGLTLFDFLCFVNAFNAGC